MATKIDQTSTVEPSHVQSIVSTSASTVAASSPKVSKFGAKSGFVIPKNKLSGSLVPICKGSGKFEPGDTVKDGTTKQVHRKTKWGTDLTQDPTVRKGRALAYQTRVEQITKQLQAKSLEIGDGEDPSPTHASDHNTADNQKHESRKFEMLELEKREVIGEILRLNPTYKAPHDYKPFLKEVQVPIPLKTYPRYNFIGLLLGPQNNTQKRLEEETGATIHVWGMKAGTGEKHQISQSVTTEAQVSFEELYVNVSADTYEKIDAAVALIELLLTPVSGSMAVASTNSTSTAANTGNINGPSQYGSASSYMTTPAGASVQGVLQPVAIPTQSVQPQFQPYPGAWFQGAPANVAVPLSSGLVAPPKPNMLIGFPPSPANAFNTVNTPPLFGHTPPAAQITRNPSPVVSGPQMVAQAGPPSNQSMLGLPSPYPMPMQPSSTVASQFPATQPVSPRMMVSPRPLVPMSPQSRPITPLGPPPVRLLTASVSSSISQPSLPPTIRPQQAGSPSTGPWLPSQVNNMPPLTNFPPPRASTLPPAFPSVNSHARPLTSLPNLSTPVPQRMPSTAPQPSPLPTATPASPVPRQTPSFFSAPVPTVQTRPPPQPVATVMLQPLVQPLVPNPTLTPSQVRQPAQQPMPRPGSTSSGMPIFSSLRPSVTSPSMPPPIAPQLHPSIGDFTFQPLRGQVSTIPNLPLPNNLPVSAQPVPLAAPQAPSFRPASQTPASSVGAQGFARPPAVNQPGPQVFIQQPQPSFGSTIGQLLPRLPIFPNPHIGWPMGSAPQMGHPNFIPAPNAPVNLLQPQQNQFFPIDKPGNLQIPNEQFGGKPSTGHPRGQVYDPFSPTSVPSAPPQLGSDSMKMRKPETDAEYEDLMSSVGVR